MKKLRIDENKLTAVIIMLIFLAVVVFSFSSCMTEQKVKRWNDDHPEQEARNCAQKYPLKAGDTIVRSSIDSFDFSRDLYDVNEYINWLNRVNDSLMNIIQLTDTSCGKYSNTLLQQKKQIEALREKLRTIKPKTITIDSIITKIDSSLSHSVRLENDRLKSEAMDKDKKIASFLSASKIRLWMLIASCLLNVLLIVLFFKKKTNPVLRAVT